MLTDRPDSWRAPFIAVGGFGLIWVAIWFALLRPRDLEPASPAAATAETPPFWRILAGGRFWAVAVLMIGPQIMWQIYRVWLMKFLQTGRGYTEKAALDFNSVYFIAANLGCFAAGLGSVWLIRRRGSAPHRAQRTVYAGACLLTSLSVLIPCLGKGWLLLAVLLLIGAGGLALFPCLYSFVQELSADYVGRLTGLLGMWVWAVTSPVHNLLGRLVDRTHSYDVGLLIAGLMPWIGVISMKLLWLADRGPAPANPD